MSYESLAAFYDRLQDAGTDYGAIGAYYHKKLLQNGAKSGILLDLACGTGVLSRYFANRNYDVIGADISAEMLSEAMKNPHQNIQYLRQDMTELDLFGTIDCCICTLDVFNHLPDEAALRQALSRISLFMNVGGALVFDVNTLYKHEIVLAGNTFVYDLDDVYCTWSNSLCEDGRVGMTLDIFEREASANTWKRHRESIIECAYPLSEITKMVEEAGFGDVKIYDWLSDLPPDEISEKAVFTAIKT
jgi:SAM-dependent methyltransferase